MNKINNSGFSMVQIMMAAGMMGILSLGMMKMMENQNKSAHAAKARAAAQSFYMETKAYLARPGYCQINFKGLKVSKDDEFELDDILKPNGEALYKLDDIYTGVLRIESITTSNFEKDGETSGLMHLKFKLGKIGKSYGAKSYTKVVKLNLLLDENGTIRDCLTFGVGSIGIMGTGSEAEINAEQGVKDLNSNKKSENSERVESVIKKSATLKELNNSLKTIQEANQRMKEMLED